MNEQMSVVQSEIERVSQELNTKTSDLEAQLTGNITKITT
jgi:uncharacterized small protein (DUF1192 family)